MNPFGTENCVTCDVLVVGAGPAGSTAAILLSQMGFSVIVVEKDIESKGKVCGDLLGPRSVQRLEKMNLVTRIAREGGQHIHAVKIFDEKGLIGIGTITPAGLLPNYGIGLERAKFDEFLRAAAEEAGAHLLRGIRIERIMRQENGCIHSQGISGLGEVRFRSKMILGADGVNSTVARQTGLFRRIPKKMILAVRSYYQDVPDLYDGIELYFHPKLLPGYGWVIPVDTRRANIGIGIRADVCISRHIPLQRHFYQFIHEHPTLSKRVKEARPTGAIRGWSMGLYGQAHKNYASNILLLGDAGNFVDPLSGEGIYGAIESAHHAAVTCGEAFQAQRFDQMFLARYEARWRQTFHEDFHYADRLISMPIHRRGLSSFVLWGIRKISRRGLVDEEYARTITGFFCGVIPRREALRMSFIRKSLF